MAAAFGLLARLAFTQRVFTQRDLTQRALTRDEDDPQPAPNADILVGAVAATVFLAGSAMAAVSLLLARLVPLNPAAGNEVAGASLAAIKAAD